MRCGKIASERSRSLDVSRETLERLQSYADLLVKWQRAINLVAPSRSRASGPAISWIRPKSRSSARSIKTGPILAPAPVFPASSSRFPAAERPEPGSFHLIESDRRKASFLREAARVTGVSAEIHACRAEDILPELRGRVTAVTARALAPLPSLLALAEPLLTTGAEGFFPKGETLRSELQRASEIFAFDSRAVPSQSDEKGRILVIRDLRRRFASILGTGNEL